MPNYSDEDITFFMGLYRDHERAEGALGRIREHFPDARVIVRSDGDRDPKNRKLAERYNTDVLGGGAALSCREWRCDDRQNTRTLFRSAY